MAFLPIHRYFTYNGELKPVDEFLDDENDGGIYEVLRIIGGVPLFLEDHMERFYMSAKMANFTIAFSPLEIRKMLKTLIRANSAEVGNLLISCKQNLKICFVAHNYPADSFYRDGVGCGILRAERKTPNAKVFQSQVREESNEIIARDGFYEVFLVDHLGRITEGSRSNVFFVEGKNVVTPPAHEVLLGVTRQKTLGLARKLGFQSAEKDVGLNEIERFQAAFITGTSPKILPISSIGNVTFDPENQTLDLLRNAYDAMIEEYVRNASNNWGN